MKNNNTNKMYGTILFSQVFDQDKQNRSLRNFRGVLCEEIAKISNLLPSVCGGH